MGEGHNQVRVATISFHFHFNFTKHGPCATNNFHSATSFSSDFRLYNSFFSRAFFFLIGKHALAVKLGADMEFARDGPRDCCASFASKPNELPTISCEIATRRVQARTSRDSM